MSRARRLQPQLQEVEIGVVQQAKALIHYTCGCELTVRRGGDMDLGNMMCPVHPDGSLSSVQGTGVGH